MLIRVAFLAAALPGLAAAQAVDTRDATSVALAILAGYAAQDIAAIAPHSNETNSRFFAALMRGDEDPSELFEGTRGESATGWTGGYMPARYRSARDGDPEALIPFAYESAAGIIPLTEAPTSLEGLAEARGRYVSIVLHLDGPNDSSWGFEDINYINPLAYLEAAETR